MIILSLTLNISADAFVHHSESIYSSYSQPCISPHFVNSDFLPMSPISADEVCVAIKSLKPFKGMGADGIPSFIIKGCSRTSVPLLVYIFNISLTSQIFLSPWKRSVVIPVYKERQQLFCQ